MSSSIRAFIAVELPTDLKDTIAQIQTELKKSGADVKWVKPENCHITIKFLGDVSSEQIGSIQRVLDECGRSQESFRLTMNSAGAFPTTDKPNIIWLGLTDENNRLAEITAGVEERLSNIGFPKEARPFTAHITIGRTRSGSTKALSQTLKTMTVPTHNIDIKTLTLFQSKLSSTGPSYSVLFQSYLK